MISPHCDLHTAAAVASSRLLTVWSSMPFRSINLPVGATMRVSLPAIPPFAPRSTSDLHDLFAMLLEWTVYTGLESAMLAHTVLGWSDGTTSPFARMFRPFWRPLRAMGDALKDGRSVTLLLASIASCVSGLSWREAFANRPSENPPPLHWNRYHCHRQCLCDRLAEEVWSHRRSHLAHARQRPEHLG